MPILPHSSRAFEHWLEGQGEQLRLRCEEELQQALVAPDFHDLVSRVLRRHPGYWSEEQRAQLQALEAFRGELDAPDADALVLEEREFQAQLGPLFVQAREQAQKEAVSQVDHGLGHVGSPPVEEAQSRWKGWWALLGFEHAWWRWSMAAATSIAVLWGGAQLVSTGWLHDLNKEYGLASFLSDLSPRRTLHQKKSGLGDRGGADTPVMDLARPGPRFHRSAPKRQIVSAGATLPKEKTGGPSESKRSRTDKKPREKGNSIAELEALAQRAWGEGEYAKATALYRKIIAMAPASVSAELAWGDLFLVLRDQGDDAARREAWDSYRKQFPRGRFAQHALAGICRSESGAKASECWTRYLEAYPKGLFIHEAQELQ